MKRHLVILARVPQRGRVKRRLAAGIGAGPALRFYREILGLTVRRCAGDRRWLSELWLTPDPPRGLSSRRVDGRRLLVRGQGRGDLGQRMARPFRRLPPGPVVLIGSDIPDVSAELIHSAFVLLGRYDLVFGPAEDGGFWLVGARRLRAWPRGLFEQVRWSSPHTLADTLARVPRRYSVGLVATLTDIDDVASYRRWENR